MGLLILVLSIIALIIAWAYLRLIFKRLQVFFTLRRLCRGCGCTLQGTHPLWFLGSRYLKGCDCLIRTPRDAFAVKLFGCLWPLKSLILREYGEYIFRAHAAFLTAVLDVYDGYPHALTACRVPESAGDAVRRVLLINPLPLEILLQPSNGQEHVSGPGDFIQGMEIANLSHLVRIVENACRTHST